MTQFNSYNFVSCNKAIVNDPYNNFLLQTKGVTTVFMKFNFQL